MARWSVGYWPCEAAGGNTGDASPGVGVYRVFPEGEPERWLAQINPDLPDEMQRENAYLIAEALTNILGLLGA